MELMMGRRDGKRNKNNKGKAKQKSDGGDRILIEAHELECELLNFSIETSRQFVLPKFPHPTAMERSGSDWGSPTVELFPYHVDRRFQQRLPCIKKLKRPLFLPRTINWCLSIANLPLWNWLRAELSSLLMLKWRDLLRLLLGTHFSLVTLTEKQVVNKWINEIRYAVVNTSIP